ncbi:MAG: ATP-binding cassette domain-containing protein [Bacteroidia bacterium]|jgi:phospholipid/cholesterol/gamma-HCH transport system ATP-binding protein|nr:ATP-binding cassette domain-containing protein [Bacteroidia bacterium]MBP9179916.1 ATP-binding cassette domain-containing protein [Bacteroidia bacterium]MBP9724191.1 ATP-binding cassette domain-containing protein [Bacteroidia bacterium]
MIEVKNISKAFGEKKVLEDVSATFLKGKTNFIIGASGSGKSVMMKCMVGLEEVDSGAILYEGRDFTHLGYEERKDIRKEIGMLFQGTALFDSLTVQENVEFPLKMFSSMSSSERLDRVNTCLQRVNLQNVNQLYPSSLSGGMKKRVGIARAISLNPSYLFCDEPNSGLDPLTSRVIDELIKEITEEYNITTIINTHDMKSVFDMGENIIFIWKGKKWWDGHRKQIRTSGNEELYDFMKAYDIEYV